MMSAARSILIVVAALSVSNCCGGEFGQEKDKQAITEDPMLASQPAIGRPPSDSFDSSSLTDQLIAARDWAKRVAQLPKFESLVLPVSFFKERLARRPNGQEGITEFAHRPILDAMRLHRAMTLAATRIPADSQSDRFIDAWHEEKADLLKSLPERNAATPLIVELWKEFTDAWEQEVLRVDKARFREALIQAPLIVTAVLLELDERHIADAITRPTTDTGSVAQIIAAQQERAGEREAQARTQNVSLAWWLGPCVLVFTLFVVLVEVWIMILRRQPWEDGTFKLIGLTLIVNAGVFLTVSIVDRELMSPMFGLMGALAGYILGRDASLNVARTVQQPPAAVAPPAPAPPP